MKNILKNIIHPTTRQTSKEAPFESARAGSERFCSQASSGKCGNTVCISHFSERRLGAKDPLSSRRRFDRSFRKRLPMPEPVRKGFRRYSCAVLTGALILGLTMPAYAAGDPLTVVNNLSTFIFGLIRAVGLILLGWGIVQVGLSLQSHDPSQRSNGFLTLAGGIVITFAKEILDLIIA